MTFWLFTRHARHWRHSLRVICCTEIYYIYFTPGNHTARLYNKEHCAAEFAEVSVCHISVARISFAFYAEHILSRQFTVNASPQTSRTLRVYGVMPRTFLFKWAYTKLRWSSHIRLSGPAAPPPSHLAWSESRLETWKKDKFGNLTFGWIFLHRHCALKTAAVC